MKQAIVFLNSPIVTLGTLEPALIENEFQITLIDATTTDIRSINPEQADLLIILGGPQPPYQTEKYPYLTAQIEFIKKRVEKDLPTIGIAMGAQLIAIALGSEVTPGSTQNLSPVINWQTLSVTEKGKTLGLDLFTTQHSKVLCWQDDYYKAPKNSTILASAEPYGQQAFLYGKHVLALQFHAEVTDKILSNWLQHLTDQLKAAYITKEQFIVDTQHHIKIIENNATSFWKKWLNASKELQ